jgi:hypothetical protein
MQLTFRLLEFLSVCVYFTSAIAWDLTKRRRSRQHTNCIIQSSFNRIGAVSSIVIESKPQRNKEVATARNRFESNTIYHFRYDPFNSRMLLFGIPFHHSKHQLRKQRIAIATVFDGINPFRSITQRLRKSHWKTMLSSSSSNDVDNDRKSPPPNYQVDAMMYHQYASASVDISNSYLVCSYSNNNIEKDDCKNNCLHGMYLNV